MDPEALFLNAKLFKLNSACRRSEVTSRSMRTVVDLEVGDGQKADLG